jgi:hypothetical protein
MRCELRGEGENGGDGLVGWDIGVGRKGRVKGRAGDTDWVGEDGSGHAFAALRVQWYSL